MYDITVFKNLRFRPSIHKREATLERSVFEKMRFSTGTVFTEYVWTAGQAGRKISSFNQDGYVWTGL